MEIADFQKLLPFELYDYQNEYIGIMDQAKSEQKNMLINAPTGFGKTVALYYAMCAGKTIYSVPIRALGKEKLDEIPDMFSHIRLLKDDGADFADRKEMDYVNQDLIITTTERLLSMLNGNVRHDVLKNVEHIVFDEIHLINDVNRGSAVEWVIMTLKREYPHIQLIGLTATLQNYVEFSDWFDGYVFYRPPEARPIPLTYHYNPPVTKQRTANQTRELKFGQLIKNTMTFKEPFLIFMASKISIEAFARKFARVNESASYEQMWAKGVGVHHADLDEPMKHKVVEKFIAGELTHVFCSPTLAMGVNVPATNVAIFDISFWDDKAWQHIPNTEPKLRQMWGRAGRKGFSEFGRVFFYGEKHEIHHAKWAVENPQDSNSQFGRIIVDKILNMIVRGTARDIDTIYEIIKESFLFHQRGDFDKTVIDTALSLLEKYSLVTRTESGVYRAKEKGRKVMHLWVPVHTYIDAVRKLMDAKKQGSFSLFDLYRIFLGNDEFLSTVPFDERRDDKFVNESKYYFRKSKQVRHGMLINSYNPHENQHQLIDKSNNLLKVLALIFKDEIMGKKFKSYTSGGTLRKWRQQGSGLISKLADILDKDLAWVIKDKSTWGLMEKSIKYGTLNEKKLELFQIEGIGDKTIEKLLARGIDTRRKLLGMTKGQLKRYRVGISYERLQKLQSQYAGTSYNPQTSLTDW